MVSRNLFPLKPEYLKIFENMDDEVHIYELVLNDKNEIIDLIFKYINPASSFNSYQNILGKKISSIYESKKTVEDMLFIANEVLKGNKNKKFEIYRDNKIYSVNAFQLEGLLITIYQDITEQTKLENWTQIQSDALYDVKDTVILLDGQKRIIYWNKGAEELFGYTLAEVIDKKILTLLKCKWLTADERKNAYRQLRSLGKWHGKNLATKKDGKEIYVHSLIKTFKDEKGRHKEILLILNDVTVPTNMEQALEANYKRLQDAQRIGKIGNWEWDINSNIITISDGLYRIYGIDPSKYVKYETIMDMVVPEDHEVINQALEKALREHKPFKYDVTICRKDGDLREISCRGEVITDFAGHPLKIVCVEQDITERKEIEYALWEAKNELESTVKRRTRELNETNLLLQNELKEKEITENKLKKSEIDLKNMVNELKRSNDELQQFAYITSHDLQEPLRTVSSFTQLLERRYKSQLDPDADEFIQYIVEASTRMQVLIKDLLQYSRVTTRGKEFKPVNTEEILNETIANLNAAILENNAEVSYENLPELIADSRQIGQLFQNLISNAIKFKKSEVPPKIHISAKKKDNKFIFSVRDNGIGIKKEYFDRIFTIFQRLHTREEYSGTGIGLSIAKKIVERHGGDIWLESKPDKGSTFYFSIPKHGY